MNRFAEVFLWGTRIGIVYLPENAPYAGFEYDKDFLLRAEAAQIQPSPLHMPLSSRVYSFPDLGSAFHGVPGMIADSLPDRFGNAVIRSWLASQGKTEADFTVIDRLCYTGKRGMGALEYVPALGPAADAADAVNVSEMVRFASEILQKRSGVRLHTEADFLHSGLLQLGTSAGGARAKAIIAWNEKTNDIRSGQIDAGEGYDYWLMKFDGVDGNGDHDLEDIPEYTLIEYAYYQMALAAGIEMAPCRIFREGGRNHFMTRRFDRTDGKKLHMQTLGALAHIDYNLPGICGYEQAAMYMRKLGLLPRETEQFFRRMVFNVLAVNQDDHVKNISFLMTRDGTWHLAPAYDVTFACDAGNRWLQAHQMTVNGKWTGIKQDDLIAAGRSMDLSGVKIHAILEEVRQAVAQWPVFASETGIREKTYTAIADIMQDSLQVMNR
ncbi:MAG: type II toxin-antitoxin system HipA family toxin [Lachnospiraceae bacterium]|nr:type II toxin-antitoxin system HipA family toxin [Lachnospiraceae bacterium]